MRSSIIERIGNYFTIREWVCPHVYNAFGGSAWSFIDDRLLETVLFIREGIGQGIVINNWHAGGQFSQRGLRCNLCQLVKEKSDAGRVYLTAHAQGTGVDFDVLGMSAREVRDWLRDHRGGLPYPIRLERDVTWVHLDLRNDGENAPITYFSA